MVRLAVAVVTAGFGVLVGCDTASLRTGSKGASGGADGGWASDAASPDDVASPTGGAGQGQDGVGTGGAATLPSGTGGATGALGLGGNTNAVPGTGGAVPQGTGGRTAGATGGSVSPGAGGSTAVAVTVNLAQTKQTIEGFGINISWAPTLSDADADALFDPTTGLGLTLVRFAMTSNGSPVSSNITGDLTKARARGVTQLIGTCASPRALCKDNNNENNGGHLLESCYESWSDTILKFATAQGLYAMSIANEPDFASCGDAEPCNGSYPTTLYTAEELAAFLKVAGPKLQKAGIKVIAPEPAAWGHAWSNDLACCSEPSGKPATDPLGCGSTSAPCAPGKGYDYGHVLYQDAAAWAAFDILGVHQYDTHEAKPWPADVPDRKPTWQTEAGGVQWWPEHGPSGDIANGVAVAGWIHDALVNGDASAWLWFWYKASSNNDNLSLLLSGAADTKRHYTLANYSRFIRPGYLRVETGATVPEGLLLSAYKGADGTVVIVAVNRGSGAATVALSVAGGTVPASFTPWVTSASDDLKSGVAIPVSGGAFTATLPGQTVTTFVGK
jgi:O-glycosyl hydrolase